jgi:hypothetical protein
MRITDDGKRWVTEDGKRRITEGGRVGSQRTIGG